MGIKNPRCKCGKIKGEIYMRIKKQCGRCRSKVRVRTTE
tara:strand:- start:1492 stop:1608 length:117 start_codon:yes stop_codon:yes gene_type:complete